MNQKDYEFMKEKIKDKPGKTVRFGMKVILVLVLAVIFGIAACITFVVARPSVEKLFLKIKGEAVTIPKDDAGGEGSESSGGDAVVEDSVSSEDEDIPDTVYITEKQELELSDYQNVIYQLYTIGKEANHSVVTVTGVSNGTDWFNDSYEREGQGTGIIFLKNERELLVLSEKKNLVEAESIHVTFQNGEQVEAKLKKYDGNTGIAVLSVALGSLTQSLQDSVKAIELGNSYQVIKGTVVLAVGNFTGENYSILCGNVTNSSAKISTWDANYTVLNTDMVASENGAGVLINLEGQVVGIILQDYASANDTGSTVTALSISELKALIEDLSNGGDIPYLGVKISMVTEQIAKENGLPIGVYVKEIRADSPAMAAGLQAGDVIVKIGAQEITSEKIFTETLMKYRPEQKMNFTVKRMRADGQYQEVACETTLQMLD